MNKWYVFYDDDYCEDGGMGFKGFDNSELALRFIEERMIDRDEEADISEYRLIEGVERRIVPYQQITKITVE